MSKGEDRTPPPQEPPISTVQVTSETVPALVACWSEDEPDRAAQVTFFPHLGVEVILGREGGSGTRADWYRQRPGVLDRAPPIVSIKVAREHLAITRVEGGLDVRWIRGAKLLVNGKPTERALVRPGDTVGVEHAMLFYFTERPEVMPPLRHGDMDFPFGEADPYENVGESAAAWAMRVALLAAAMLTDLAADGDRGHVLITGESGTGKEAAARTIHERSERGRRKMVAHSAAALPAGLIDAEIFGHAKDFPNSGMLEMPGLIAEADGSSFFLDEIGQLPVELHGKFLRALDKRGEFKRLGESKARTSNFRLIAATNSDPALIKHDLLGRFTVTVDLPSLRDRREDIPLIVRDIVVRVAKSKGVTKWVRQVRGRTELKITPEFLDALVRWPYTTNVREIGRLLKHSITQSPGGTLRLPKEMRAFVEGGAATAVAAAPAREVKAVEEAAPVVETKGAGKERARREAEVERKLTVEEVRSAMATHGSHMRAAAALGVSRHALYRLIRKFGLE